jgi:hypothetical protein
VRQPVSASHQGDQWQSFSDMQQPWPHKRMNHRPTGSSERLTGAAGQLHAAAMTVRHTGSAMGQHRLWRPFDRHRCSTSDSWHYEGLRCQANPVKLGLNKKEVERIVSWDSGFDVKAAAKSMKGCPGVAPLPHSVATRLWKPRGPLGASSVVTIVLPMTNRSLCAAA